MPARASSLLMFFVLAASPAAAQTPPDPSAVRSSLEQIFSIATFGAISLQNEPAEVTQQGSNYQVRVPLSGFSAPPNAALNATAHPIANGLLEITSMTFPSAGTIETASPGKPPIEVIYTIGQQDITAKVDPTLTRPSSYQAAFGQLRVLSENGGQRAEQTIDRYKVDGTLSAGQGGLVTLASQGSGTGLHFTSHGANGFASDTSVRALAGHFSVDGLNRAQATQLLAAARRLAAIPRTPGQPQAAAPERRQALQAMVSAANGLMNRLEADEILEDVRFAIGAPAGATNGTIARVRLNMTGEAVDQRLDTHLGIALDGLSSTTPSATNTAFMPHHVDIKAVLAGVQIGPLMALLRAATQEGLNQALLQPQAQALFADPRARIGIESLSFDSGPLRVTGSMRVIPRANGQLGATVHIAASGVDALLAKAQTDPAFQNIIPMVFMAKGMGRPQGDSLIWDIELGNGPVTVNGVPFGQALGRTR